MQELPLVEDQPSEFRKILTQVSETIKNLHHFRDMTQIMSQMLDSMDVSMLTNEKALVIGRITADHYGMIVAMLGMQKFQLEFMEQFWSRMGADNAAEMSKKVSDAELATKTEINRVFEDALPEHLQAYMKKIEGKKFHDILDEALKLLTELNAKVLTEFNPTLASTKYAIAYSLPKIFDLCRISDKEDLNLKLFTLMTWMTNQLIESCEHIDQLFEGKVQLSTLAHLFTATKDLVHKLAWKENFVTEDFKEVDAARLLISLIPLEVALNEMLQANEAKMLKVSSEFYETVQFSEKLTPEQMEKMAAASPKLMRLMMAVQNVQLVTLAWDLDPAGFFDHFFELTEDQEFQLYLLKITFERTLQLAPDLIVSVLQLVDIYCDKNPEKPGAKVLVELRQQFQPHIKAHEQRMVKARSASLHQESFTDFLRMTMDPNEAQAVPLANVSDPDEVSETRCCSWFRRQ